jgi:adenylate cyclase
MVSTRRLAAILAADVAGYSRLMGADEEGTHERLRAHFAELIHSKIEEHRGRVVKNTGDGLLAEFASVVDAVRCAVDMQRGMAERNIDVSAPERIEFRIGINLGDVIAEEHDIFGDGVNLAARLEALAEPGGICISWMVRDQIRDKLPYRFEDMGEQSVKNIARPVRVYALRPAGATETPAAMVRHAALLSQPAAAPRLSIVVLPFTNLSDDREQQYFADGITEDVTTDLSRIPHSFVISCSTAFTYRNKPIDTKQIGRELGVRYVLEGSIRRSGNRVRITAQLIDAETDAHLWAERFDGDTTDLIALQDEITSRIAIALNVELIAAEAARPTEHPDAIDYILRGRATRFKPYSRGVYLEVVGLFERALALDPLSVEAQSRLAIALAGGVIDSMTDTAELDILRAEGLTAQALAASPRSALPHHAKGTVLRAQRRYAEAIPEHETVLALDRNDVSTLFYLAQCKLFTGSIEETIPLVERAIQLSPRDPGLSGWYQLIGQAHLLQSRTEDAILWLEKARNYMPAHSSIHRDLAAAYALRGQIERAAAELTEARRLSSDDRYSSTARLKAVYRYSGMLKIRALIDATYIEGLRKAGMPEE